MKRIIGIFSLAGLFITTACSNNQPASTETKTEKVIVVPPPAQAPVTNPPPKNTTIVLDKNGVKVGTKKVDVVINPPKKGN